MKTQNRLKKRKHFNYIYKMGQSKNSQFVKLVFIKSKFKPFKVGFSVSKKIGNSVVRNKVKRRMKEIIYSFSSNMSDNFNYIFVAKQGIENLNFEKLKQEIKKLIIKAGIYDEKNC